LIDRLSLLVIYTTTNPILYFYWSRSEFASVPAYRSVEYLPLLAILQIDMLRHLIQMQPLESHLDFVVQTLHKSFLWHIPSVFLTFVHRRDRALPLHVYKVIPCST